MPLLRTLTARIFVLTAAVTLLCVGLMAYVLVHMHGAHLERQAVEEALRLSDTIRRSTRYSMLHNRKEDVYEIVRTVGAQPGIERIRIYSKSGDVRFSTLDAERGTAVDKDAEACTACHQAGEPVARPPDLTRVFDSNGHRVLGLITPVNNEPACAGASCHASAAEQQILGVLDLQVSLENVDSAVAAQDRGFLSFTALMMLVIASTCGAFLWVFVHRPTRALIRGTEELRRGNLDYRIAAPSDTELGRLADAFNRMAENLFRAREELTVWARTLEERVAQKTRTLEEAQSRLVESERLASLGSLSAAVAHEINNPLAGVLTYARLIHKILKREPSGRDADVFRYLDAVESEVARCGKIVRNLLDFARGSDLSAQVTDASRVLDRALMLLGHRMELQSVRLDREDGDLPQILCDPDQVQQAVLAVLINALEAMEEGGTLTVRTRSRVAPAASGGGVSMDGPPREAVEIEIKDTGPGIPEEIRSRIFEPFFTTKSSKKGVGLGLSVVYGIVKRHEGEIRIGSEEGKGTSVTLVFPRTPNLEAPPGEGAVSRPALSGRRLPDPLPAAPGGEQETAP